MSKSILEQFYQQVEQSASKSFYKVPLECRSIFHEALQLDLDSKVRRHLEFEAGFWNGHWTTENWEPFKYGVVSFDISTFTNEDWAYFKHRTSTVVSPVLRALYAHFVWQYQRSAVDLAKFAIDSYLDWASVLEAKDASGEEGFFGVDLEDILPRALALCMRSGRHRLEDIKNTFMQLGTKHNGQSALLLAVKLGEQMVEQRRVFNVDDLQALEKQLWTLAANQPAGDFETLNQSALDLGARVSAKRLKRGNPEPVWLQELGEFRLRIAETRDFHTGKTVFLQLAIQAFREAGDKIRMAHAMELFESARTDGKLGVITVEYTEAEKEAQNKRFESIVEFAKETAKQGFEHVLEVLATAGYLLPDVATLTQAVESFAEQSSVLNRIFPIMGLDARGNVAEGYYPPVGKARHEFMQLYKQSLISKTHPFVGQLLVQGIKISGLNADQCIEFFKQHTWLGEVFETPNLLGKTRKEHWLSLLEPAIRVYFDALCAHVNEEKELQPPVLFVDSVVIKLEGMLRRIFTDAGIPTVKIIRDVQRESDINDFLNHEKIHNWFDENTLAFLRFVLIDKGGLNLRHEVSHALLNLEDYDGFGQAELLFVALLRIACPLLPKQKPTLELQNGIPNNAVEATEIVA
jgi:hypothetical protein